MFAREEGSGQEVRAGAQLVRSRPENARTGRSGLEAVVAGNCRDGPLNSSQIADGALASATEPVFAL